MSQQFYSLWIEPEIEKRKLSGILPDNFAIAQCLIRLPKNELPIVDFNEEVGWVVHAKRGNGEPLNTGDPIHLHEISLIHEVEPPAVDGKRVAFVFLYRDGVQNQWCFDFTPNHSDAPTPNDDQKWSMNDAIAGMLQEGLKFHASEMPEDIHTELSKIGLWAIPALLLYPMTHIAKLVREENVDKARDLIVRFLHGNVYKFLGREVAYN